MDGLCDDRFQTPAGEAICDLFPDHEDPHWDPRLKVEWWT